MDSNLAKRESLFQVEHHKEFGDEARPSPLIGRDLPLKLHSLWI